MQFLIDTAKLLVNKPDEVRVERKVDDRGVLLILTVGEGDMGYVVGKAGIMAKALRVVVRSIGAKENARVAMTVHDPKGEGYKRTQEGGATDNDLGV